MDWLYRIGAAVEEGVTLMGSMFHHVPETVWAALIAAGVAFLTTTLSNRNSRKQLQMQLTHNAGQQKQEREMALRRDVHLPVIEAIVRARTELLGSSLILILK